MEFILDFQGFKNENNEFIIKELAIISTDGQIYELQLFLPPCSLHQLSKSVRKQVHWVEKHLHGLYWSSGFKEYNKINDIFKQIDIQGNVYVKGLEKQSFIANLLSNFNVKVINLEDLGCPRLSVLKQQTNVNSFKPCNFSHPINNCAYVNVHILLQWWNIQKHIENDSTRNIDAAIKEWNEHNYLMEEELIKYLPKQFILNYVIFLDHIYDKLPSYIQSDPEVINNLRCKEHYQIETEDIDEIPYIKKKHCFFCKKNIKFEQSNGEKSGWKIPVHTST